jgi:energy-coupling factor transport system permease protein
LASPTKIFYPLFFSVIILLVENIFVNAIIVLIVSITLFGVVKPARSTIKLFTLGWILLSITMSFFYLVLSNFQGNVILQIGPFDFFGFQIGPLLIVDRAAYLLGTMLLRFLAMFYISAILLSSLNQRDILATAEWLRLPWAVSFMLSLGFRTMVWFLEDITVIREALQSRGLDFNKGGIVRRIRTFLSMFVPLIGLSIRRIPIISQAVESRGFKPSRERRKIDFYGTKLRKLDYAIIGFCLIAGTLMIYMKITGQVFLGYPF